MELEKYVSVKLIGFRTKFDRINEYTVIIRRHIKLLHIWFADGDRYYTKFKFRFHLDCE